MGSGSLQSQGFLPVATATLFPATEIKCDLYLHRPGHEVELYRNHSCPLAVDDLQRLTTSGIDHLYIRAADAELYRTYLCQQVLHESKLPTEVRVSALREVTRVAFQEALEANDPNHAVHMATDLGRQLAHLIADQAVALHEMFQILEHDYYTFTHVCNVSTYCVMLARDLGYTATHELAQVATGALLHDIGKRHISPEVLNKPDKLTDDEWVQVREHPVSGFRELMGRGDLSWPQLMMVYQHHERLDGSGYPAGITGDEMHPWARVCAVADVFDALTCQRPYRRAMPLADVCDYLDKYAGVWFDREAVGCWTSHVRSVAHE
jgi:HD-GYP domain-containing protein (c-di-GMP phosphodiesterase class II)